MTLRAKLLITALAVAALAAASLAPIASAGGPGGMMGGGTTGTGTGPMMGGGTTPAPGDHARSRLDDGRHHARPPAPAR